MGKILKLKLYLEINYELFDFCGCFFEDDYKWSVDILESFARV